MAQVADERQHRELAADGQQALAQPVTVGQGAAEHDEREEERAQVGLLEHEGGPAQVLGVEAVQRRPDIRARGQGRDEVERPGALAQRTSQGERHDGGNSRREDNAHDLEAHATDTSFRYFPSSARKPSVR